MFFFCLFQISHSKLESEAGTPSPQFHEYVSPPLTPTVASSPVIQQPAQMAQSVTSSPTQSTTKQQFQAKPELVKHDSLPDSHRLRIATRTKIGEGSCDEDSAISQTSSTSGYRLKLFNIILFIFLNLNAI